ncbi:MAG: helix-hairpin-helix domain-containing protein [Alphaproteobacteria bacterium]|nr:helix-hairpin-helix domain-containing protein [Alphaproteobacteria bacterium]
MKGLAYRISALLGLTFYLVASNSVAAQAAPGEMEAITKASDLDPDPADGQAVATVCTACHSSAQFLTAARPYRRWEQTMQDMLDRGAMATDEQLDRILTYLVKNITMVNLNSSPADQLAMTLQIPAATAQEIVSKRSGRAFTNIDELRDTKGINMDVLQKLAAKHLLQF